MKNRQNTYNYRKLNDKLSGFEGEIIQFLKLIRSRLLKKDLSGSLYEKLYNLRQKALNELHERRYLFYFMFPFAFVRTAFTFLY